ncbi:MAG: GNAT family N-acetyltransferase [Proteobacteria bacterium]|nr:GNAT family N-acetyltransferase [Pseudomonadota bacterium]
MTEETPETLYTLWRDPRSPLRWDCLFALPPWLRSWERTVGCGTSWVRAFWAGAQPVGVAPLLRDGDAARFLGSPDLCDYGDLVLAPGWGEAVGAALLGHLEESGVRLLELAGLRPDAVARGSLPVAAEAAGWTVAWEPDGVSVGLELPGSWEAFLERLGKKERHEVRRKLRRLEDAGDVQVRRVGAEAPVGEAIEVFLRLFAGYRRDKEIFLTPERRAFFAEVIGATAREGLLDLAFLELDGNPVAGVLCFVHGGTTYLYNNGYDPAWEHLSAGTLSKVLSIRESIERGALRYDLLRGGEAYKLRLGGQPVPLARCRLSRP